MSTSTTAIGLRLLRPQPGFISALSSPSFCSHFNTAFAPIRPFSIHRPLAIRSFNPIRHYAKLSKSSKLSKTPKSAKSVSAPEQISSPRYFSIEENLGRAGHETVLYQSGSRMLIYIYYTLSAASISWAGWEFYENVICQPDAPDWTKIISSIGAGTGIVIFMYSFWVPSRIIHRIIAVPRRNTTPPSITLNIQARSLIPFRRRTLTLSPNSVALTSPFHKPTLGADKWEFTGYFGFIKYAGWKLFQLARAVKRALRMEDFATLKAGGSLFTYRLDREGWAWERDRRGLDMLLKGEYRSLPYAQKR